MFPECLNVFLSFQGLTVGSRSPEDPESLQLSGAAWRDEAPGLDWIGLDWTILVWTGLDWSILVWSACVCN